MELHQDPSRIGMIGWTMSLCAVAHPGKLDIFGQWLVGWSIAVVEHWLGRTKPLQGMF